jgi:hypothetical protein
LIDRSGGAGSPEILGLDAGPQCGISAADDSTGKLNRFPYRSCERRNNADLHFRRPLPLASGYPLPLSAHW